MANEIPGYHGVLLEVDLTNRKINQIPLSKDDAANFVGGRGLGMKMLWDRLRRPYVDAMSPENPLMILTGPYEGYPIPYAARHTIVCKHPQTSPIDTTNPHASTISYASCGGFFGPTMRLTGYDGFIFTGKADTPVIVVIDDGKVEIRDGRKYWGMLTYDCEKQIVSDLGVRHEVVSIGPAAENGVTFSGVLHTLGRAAGRGGVGTVMGSKNLKAVAVRGAKLPAVADHKLFLSQIADMRDNLLKNRFSRYGTAASLVNNSDQGRQAVKNYREGTDLEAVKISGVTAEVGVWTRHISCYYCGNACKKIGVGRGGKWGNWVTEGPEYETGTLFGTNLLVHDMEGMMLAIGECDQYGFDQISMANTMGFLMECYDKGLINKKFTDGIDLKWGNIQGVRDVMKNVAYKKGNLGEVAGKGVKHLSQVIGKGSEAFACHAKGHEYAAHNLHANSPARPVGYTTCNRGACHRNGNVAADQNNQAMENTVTLCSSGFRAMTSPSMSDLLNAITGGNWNQEKFVLTGERIWNLEKCFNYREDFRRVDDEYVPERFFTEPLTVGPYKGAVVDRKAFLANLDTIYKDRGWDNKTSKPSQERLEKLGLGFAWKEIANL